MAAVKKKAAKKKAAKKRATHGKAAAKDLTGKQKQFVIEYVQDFNATQAAIRAGYSKNGADVTGHRLLGNAKIAEAIAKASENITKEAQVDAAYVLKKAVQYLETNIADFLVMPDNGGMPYFDLGKATPEQLAAIDSLQLDTSTERDGEDEDGNPVYVHVRKIKLGLPKRKELLELIGKHRAVQAFSPDQAPPSPQDRAFTIEVVGSNKVKVTAGADTDHS